MAATTMPLTSLLKKLSADYPEIHLVEGEHFLWSPEKSTISYEVAGDPALLLHELGHALLGHAGYERDIELIAIERDAWSKAAELSSKYGVTIAEDTAEDHLDTYRDWLHARSTCPACTSTGYQTGLKAYACPACSQTWSVNEARVCQLRRTKTNTL